MAQGKLGRAGPAQGRRAQLRTAAHSCPQLHRPARFAQPRVWRLAGDARAGVAEARCRESVPGRGRHLTQGFTSGRKCCSVSVAGLTRGDPQEQSRGLAPCEGSAGSPGIVTGTLRLSQPAERQGPDTGGPEAVSKPVRGGGWLHAQGCRGGAAGALARESCWLSGLDRS